MRDWQLKGVDAVSERFAGPGVSRGVLAAFRTSSQGTLWKAH